MISETTTTATTVTEREFDTDGELRTETITLVKGNTKTVTERSYDSDGLLRTEKVTQTDTTTSGYRFGPDGSGSFRFSIPVGY